MNDGLKAEHRAAIIDILAANERVEQAVLFGSRAMETFTAASDVDIALFGDHLTMTDEAKLAVAMDELPMAQRVDLLLYKTINDKALRKHIDQHGIKWYRRQQVEREHSLEDKKWRRMSFAEAVVVNPAVRLERGMAYPFINMAAVTAGSRCVCAVDQRAYSGGGSRFQGGDTLMARITPCLENGKVARYCADQPSANAHGSTEFIVIRGRAGVTDSEYAYYLTQWEEVRSYAVDQMTGTSGRQRVPVESLGHLLVPVPSLPEQRAIARVLGALDDKIELNRSMNETLEGMARALFKSWFVDFDPVRAKMEGRDPYLTLELWDLFPDALDEEGKPVGWTFSEIGKEVEAVGGGTPGTKNPSYWDGGEHHWATPKDLSKLTSPVLLGTDRKITDAGLKKISSGLLPVGTVLFSSRAPIGYLAIAAVPTAVNQGFIAMVCQKRLPNTFVLFWCHENLDYIKDISGGSTFAEISKRDFRPVPVLVPSEQILTAYDRLIRPIYVRIVASTRENEILAETRDVLVPSLISGDIRVREAERLIGEMT